MIVTRDKNAVRRFYTDMIRSGQPNEEGLTDPITDDFQQLLASIKDETPRRALDLGYGFGNYSIALAQRGFDVLAVDRIPANLFQNRLNDKEEWSRAIKIVEMDIEEFVPHDPYGVVVAKDVLHFLDAPHAANLLRTAILAAERHSYHYLVVFTDIERSSLDGSKIRIEGEADYTATQFIEMIEQLYVGWELDWNWTQYKERDRSAVEGRYYFRASRATVIAKEA